MQLASEPSVDAPSAERPPEGAQATAVVSRSPREIVWREFRRDRLALVSIGFLVLMILLAISAPVIAHNIAHHGPNQLFINSLDQFGLPTGPSAKFWFGVDDAGRDVALTLSDAF